MSLIANRFTRLLSSPWRQYATAVGAFIAVSALNLWLQKWTGYQALALVYLLGVVCLALFVGRGATIFSAGLTTLGWIFLFIPPRYSFHVADLYDQMMVTTYFVVAIIVGELTTQLRTQHQAELKAKLLAESERLGRTLLNSVSHELRTPISGIISAASGLRASGELSGSQYQLVTEIEAAGARLNRVVQSLLSAARLQSGQLRPKMDWCDVRDVVRAALREVAELTAGHPIETTFDSALPLAKMDFVLMEQALGNLISNAAIHTPRGTTIKISARMETAELLLQVADNGPGIPAGELDHIFDLFHRPPKSKPGGTGLGLAIVKGFVEAQGGRVLAANQMNGGAIFNIYLPAADSPDFPKELA